MSGTNKPRGAFSSKYGISFEFDIVVKEKFDVASRAHKILPTAVTHVFVKKIPTTLNNIRLVSWLIARHRLQFLDMI